MIATHAIERWPGDRIRLTACSTPSRRMKLKETEDLISSASFVYMLRIRACLLPAQAIMLDQPADKIETTAFFYHLAVFNFLSDVVPHIDQSHGFNFAKAH